MQWLRGQSVAAGTRMLMPQELYSHNREGLPVPVESYSTADEVSRAAETWQPDLVLLFSAYRFANDGVLSREALSTFLDSLQRRRCRVITSDPFLGLAPRLTLGEIDTRMGTALERRWWWRWLTRLSLSFQTQSKKVVSAPDLGHAVHVYPTPVPIHDEVTRLSFFNASGPGVTGPLGGDSDRDERQRWLFVLSESDLVCQRQLIGLKAFLQHLMGLLQYTIEVGRRPYVIAPPPVARRVATDLGPAIEVSTFCPFHQFERLLLDAEYAFFWSAFSVSQMIRVAHGLPIFLFDRGHFARTVRPFYEQARAWHYGGWEPPMLDQRQLFSPYVLAHLARTQLSATEVIRERWRSSPSPDVLVHQSLAVDSPPRSS